MSNNSKYKSTLALLSIFSTCLFFGYYLLFKDLVKKNTDNAQLLNQINSESGKELYTSQIKKQLSSLQGNINKVQGTIVSSDGVVTFIEELEKIAKNNGLSIKNNSISEEADSKLSTTTTFLKIRSQTHGSWAGTYKFLYELESLPYKVRVNSFNMYFDGPADPEAPQSALTWSAEFEIKLLKYK